MQSPSSHTQRTLVSIAPLLPSVPEDDVATATLTLSQADMERNRSQKPNTPVPGTQKPPTGIEFRTPVVPSLQSGERNEDGSNKKTAVEDYLQNLLRDKVKRDFPVIEFIEAVWGFSWTGIQSPQEGYELKEAAVIAYIDNRYHKAMDIKTEQSAYGPLEEIIEDLVQQITSVYPVEGTKASFVNMRDRVVDGLFAKFKPDFLWSWLKDSKGVKHSWSLAALCGELKKDVMEKFKFHATVDMAKLKKYTRTIPLPADSTEVHRPPTKTQHDTVTQLLESDAGTLPTTSQNTAPAQPSSIESVSKRKRSEDDDSESAVPQRTMSKRVRSDETGGPILPLPAAPQPENGDQDPTAGEKLSPNELQIVRYLNENGSHGIRSYATGFLIENCDITLWYIDCIGVIKSSSFNFVTESHIFVYFIASITLASFKELGICPLLKIPEGRRSLDPAVALRSYQGASLQLRSAKDIRSDSLGDLCFSLDVSDERKVVSSYGSVGRASTIIPIAADHATHKKLNKASVEAAPINATNSSVSSHRQQRPSTVRRVTALVTLVAKMSWQSKWRIGEDSLIRIVRGDLAKLKDPSKTKFLANIVDMKCSADYNLKFIDLPRAKMAGMLDSVYERVCRVLVMREYLPLHKVQSQDEFKTVFVDVVQAHHAVYETSAILHRDISPNNIMFYYRDDKAGCTQVVGVLCDWDLAKKQPRPSDKVIITDLTNSNKVVPELVELSLEELKLQQPAIPPTLHQPDSVVAVDVNTERHEPRYRTGTGPFIALDILLYNHVPYYLYRHDLESFFWVLVWFLACFNPGAGDLKYIDSWLQSSLLSIGTAKVRFLRNDTFDKIMDSTHAEYRNMLSWVDELKFLVHRVYQGLREYEVILQRAMRVEQDADSDSDSDDDDDAWFAEKMQRDVKELVERREKILTYESFMECLDV